MAEEKTVNLAESLLNLAAKLGATKEENPTANFGQIAKKAGYPQKQLLHFLQSLNQRFNLNLTIEETLTTEEFLQLLTQTAKFIAQNFPEANQQIQTAIVPNKAILNELTASLDRQTKRRKEIEESVKKQVAQQYELTKEEAEITYQRLRDRWQEIVEETFAKQGQTLGKEKAAEIAVSAPPTDPSIIRESLTTAGIMPEAAEKEAQFLTQEAPAVIQEAAALAKIEAKLRFWQIENPETLAKEVLAQRKETAEKAFTALNTTSTPAQIRTAASQSVLAPKKLAVVLEEQGFDKQSAEAIAGKLPPSGAEVLAAKAAVANQIQGRVEEILRASTQNGQPIAEGNIPILTKQISFKIAGGALLAKAQGLETIKTNEAAATIGLTTAATLAAYQIRVPQEGVKVRSILDRLSILQRINVGLPSERTFFPPSAEKKQRTVLREQIFADAKVELEQTFLTFFDKNGLPLNYKTTQEKAAGSFAEIICAPYPEKAKAILAASVAEQRDNKGELIMSKIESPLADFTVNRDPIKTFDTFYQHPFAAASLEDRFARLPAQTLARVNQGLTDFNQFVSGKEYAGKMPMHSSYTVQTMSQRVYQSLQTPTHRFYSSIGNFFQRIEQIPIVQRFINLPVINYIFHPLQTLAQKGWQKIETFFARKAAEGIAKKISSVAAKKGMEWVANKLLEEGVTGVIAAIAGPPGWVVGLFKVGKQIIDIIPTKPIANFLSFGLSKIPRKFFDKIFGWIPITGNWIADFLGKITDLLSAGLSLAFLGPLIILIFAVLIFTLSMPEGTRYMASAPPFEQVDIAAEIEEVQSKYFSVEKSVNPNSFTKDSLNSIWQSGRQAEVNFQIIITAKEKNITITDIEDTFSSYPENTNLPTPAGNIPAAEIPAGRSYTYNYTAQFNRNFLDSIVSNNVIVTANIAGGPTGEQSSDSSSVTFGNAPTLCFTFSGPWTTEQKNTEIQAINSLSQYSRFIGLLCSAGGITLTKMSGSGWGGWARGYSEIVIYDGGVRNPLNALYTLAHECGHLIDYRNSNLRANDFHNSGAYAREGFLPTYPDQSKSGEFEDFAEAIGLYPVWDKIIFSCCGRINYPSDYPLHYNFVSRFIF